MALSNPGDLCACRPWPVQPECCCPDWPDTWDEISGCTLPDRELTDEEKRALWARAAASTRLHRLTAFRWGLCEDLVRPCGPMDCRKPVGCPPLPGQVLRPFVRDGQMFNCVCACECEIRCTIRLPGPVNEVLGVWIGGEPLERNVDWFLNAEGGLARLDGCWPHAQDLAAPCGEPGTFCVQYLRGINPAGDIEAIRAVSALACSLFHQPCGVACPSTQGATRVRRNGVEWERDPRRDRRRTGVEVADDWLDVVNPRGLVRSPSVYDPSARRWTFRGVSEFQRAELLP